MTPLNVVRNTGTLDRLAEQGETTLRAERIRRPGTEELWLALNEAAYVRGDIEVEQFEDGLDAIWGDRVLPPWILMPMIRADL